MNATNLFAVVGVVTLSGCLFSGSQGPAGEDLGAGDVSPAPDAEEREVGGGSDAASPPDAAAPDLNAPDMRIEPPDASDPDMSVPAPWVVVRRYDVNLGGSSPTARTPLAVAAFGDGFLVGYRSTDDNIARVAWYESSSDAPRQNDSLPAESGDVDFVGNGVMAVVSTHSNTSLITTVYRSTAASQTWSKVVSDDPSPVQQYHETVLALENGAPFLATGREYQGHYLDLYTVDDMTGESGTPSGLMAYPIELTNLAALGGSHALGAQVFVAGVANSNYAMVEFEVSPNTENLWVGTALSCGAAPTNARIVPLRERRAATLTMGANGTRPAIVSCVQDGAVTPFVPPVFANVVITDFDIAREDIGAAGGAALTWRGPMGVGFARVTLDNGSAATVESPWSVPDTGTANRVRVASNRQRQQWGVAVSWSDRSALYILERSVAP